MANKVPHGIRSKIVTAKVYTTTDGKSFSNYDEALRHEVSIRRMAALTELASRLEESNEYYVDDYNAHAVALEELPEFLLRHRAEILGALK